MNSKIYEYKDEQNWFIGQYSETDSSVYYQEEAKKTYGSLVRDLRSLLDEEAP